MANRSADRRARSLEKRFVVRCVECGDDIGILKSQVRWTDEFPGGCGHIVRLEEVTKQLAKQGWDVHELTKGRGSFRERVTSLPLPGGGSFRAGSTLNRSDTADRSGPRRWKFKSVDKARPNEKGFGLVR